MEQGPEVQRVPRRVAQGYFSLIFFIVLSLALVVACAFLTLMYLGKTQDLNTMESRINDTVNQPLRQMQKFLPLESKEKGNTLTYGGPFFTQLGDLAKQGMVYTKLVEKTGYGESPAAVQAIDDALAASGQKVSSLRDLIEAEKRDLAQVRTELDQTKQSLAESRKDAEAKAGELVAVQKTFRDQIDKLEAKIDDDHKASQVTIDDLKKKLDEQTAAWQKVWNDKQASDKAAKDAATALQGTITKQTQQIADLREAAKEKTPAPKPGPYGNVVDCDLVHHFCMLDRGARDGVKEGQQLLVYRQGMGNTKEAIGKVIVVRVYGDSSRADVVSEGEKKPITAGDWLYVNPPEGAEAPISETAPASAPAVAPPPATQGAYVNMGVH